MSISQKYIIIKDRVEIYKDFAINLLNYVVAYYLDKSTLTNDIDIQNHFNWCYGKVCEEFLKEGLDFTENKVLKKYFYEFYYHHIYTKGIQNSTLSYYENFWRGIFEINKQRNKTIMNSMIELYNIFDISINTEKNILEIVK